LCSRASLVYARDEQSRAHLAGAMARPESEVELAPDIAFRFNGDPPDTGRELLARLGLHPGDRPLVGLAPNMRVYERASGTGLENAYLSFIMEVIGCCTRELGAEVVLIPHEIKYSPGAADDDRFLCRLAAESAGGDVPVRAMTGEYSAAAIKSVIGRLDLLVGSRFHSIVAALSQRVPAVVLGWSHKYLELMRLFDLQQYVVDYDKLESRALVQLVRQAWDVRLQSKAILDKRVPSIQARIDDVFDRVAAVIRSGR